MAFLQKIFKKSAARHEKNITPIRLIDKKHKRDFDWRPRKGNPYEVGEKSKLRKVIQIIGIVLSFTIALAILIYHPFFHIRQYSISGLERIDLAEFEISVQGLLEYNKFLFVPAKTYIFVDVNEIQQILVEKYPLSKCVISKVFPNKLVIEVKERVSTIIYDNGTEYLYLDSDGNVIEVIKKVGEDEWHDITQTTTTTLADGTIRTQIDVLERIHTPDFSSIHKEIGDYPILFDKRLPEIDVNTQIVSANIVEGALEWFHLFELQYDLSINYLTIEDTYGHAVIHTNKGFKVKVGLKENIKHQFDNLIYVLENEIGDSKIKYIDLRYNDRIYWQ